MIAVDTNVLVRFLTRDDVGQAERAKGVIEGSAIFLSKTVLLELEWVLRTAYGYGHDAVGAALRRILGLPRVVVEDLPAIRRAIAWYMRGCDLADALHLASSGSAERFATFDKMLVRRAKALDDAPAVIEP